MSDTLPVTLLLTLAGIAYVICYLFVLADTRRTRINADEARRQREIAAEESAAQERKHQTEEGRRQEIRRTARERARIAYPELLDAQEADKDPIGPLEYLKEDEKRILAAQELVEQDPAIADYEEQGTLQYASGYSRCGHLDIEFDWPSKHLTDPVRIIDCGEAGKIELFSPKQVEAARKKSGHDRYVAILQRCHDAPNVARRVIERAKERERRQQEAVDAITTKVDDLPPLPSDRQ